MTSTSESESENENRYIDFISNKQFKALVKENIWNPYKKKSNEISNSKIFHKNVIDPIRVMIDQKLRGITYQNWKDGEIARQLDKTLSNLIGNFWQIFFGSIPGWTDLVKGTESKGVDLYHKETNTWIELKMKHNTCNSGQIKNIIRDLKEIVDEDETATAVYAYLIPKNCKSENKIWSKANHPRIKLISGTELFKLITGDKKDIIKINNALEKCLDDIRKEEGLEEHTIHNTRSRPDFLTKCFGKIKID
jgi:hypothetical protein